MKTPAAGAGGRRCRVLLVDDHNDSRRMLGLMLTISGHEVLESGNGIDALRVASSELPDVAIVDIALPGIDGYEVARRLRADPGTCSMGLIALSGYGQDEDRRCAYEAGFDEHLVKPVEAARLSETIARFSGARPDRR